MHGSLRSWTSAPRVRIRSAMSAGTFSSSITSTGRAVPSIAMPERPEELRRPGQPLDGDVDIGDFGEAFGMDEGSPLVNAQRPVLCGNRGDDPGRVFLGRL